MLRHRPVRVVLCAVAAAASLGLLQPSAHAAVGGHASAGAGGSSCSLTISCSTFVQNCSLGATNDIDASVRAATLDVPHTLTFTETAVPPALGTVNVVAFDSSCHAIGLPIFAHSGSSIPARFGTAWVAVWPQDRFAQFTWQLS